MGGMNKHGQILSDVVLFNPTHLACQKVDDREDYKFWSEDNSSALVGNKILALVTFGYTNLIELTLGQQQVDVQVEFLDSDDDIDIDD